MKEDTKNKDDVNLEHSESSENIHSKSAENKDDKNLEHRTVGFIGGKFLPFHLGHMYVILSASNYVDELYVILSSSEKRDREFCDRDGIKYIPAGVRLSWLGRAFNDIENIRILHMQDNYGNDDYNWEEGADMVKKMIGKHIDYIFSSERSYDKYFNKFYPDAKHIVIDNKRQAINISATKIRRDLYANWDFLPDCVKPYFTKKVVVIGTESCGKSTLVKKLAKVYNTNFVHEVGREYCEKYSDRLTPEMFNNIAMEHFLLQEKRLESSNKILFVDSDATITQYYLEMYFSDRHSSLIEEIIRLQDYDLAIFLEPDVKWVPDGLRSAGDDATRIKNNERLKQMFNERNISFMTVSGNYVERFMKSRRAVDRLLAYH